MVHQRDPLNRNIKYNRSIVYSIVFSHLGRGARRQADMAQNSLGIFPLAKRYDSPSRIPVPVTGYGKPRGLIRTSVLNGGTSTAPVRNGGTNGVNRESLGVSSDDNAGIINKCIHCSSQSCTCDEGFIDGDLTRTPLRPTSLFHNSPNEFQYKNREDSCTSNNCWNGDDHLNNKNSKFLEIPQQHNGDGFSGNTQSLEWREVMTDILQYEENRISDKNL